MPRRQKAPRRRSPRRKTRSRRRQKAAWDEIVVPLSPTIQAVGTDLAQGRGVGYAAATGGSMLVGYNYQTGNFDPSYAITHQWVPGVLRSVGWSIGKKVGEFIPGVKGLLATARKTRIGGRRLVK